MIARAKAFPIRVYIFTLRMAKQCYGALKTRRWLIYRIFYSKQRKSTQLQDQSDGVF